MREVVYLQVVEVAASELGACEQQKFAGACTRKRETYTDAEGINRQKSVTYMDSQ